MHPASLTGAGPLTEGQRTSQVVKAAGNVHDPGDVIIFCSVQDDPAARFGVAHQAADMPAQGNQVLPRRPDVFSLFLGSSAQQQNLQDCLGTHAVAALLRAPTGCKGCG